MLAPFSLSACLGNLVVDVQNDPVHILVSDFLRSARRSVAVLFRRAFSKAELSGSAARQSDDPVTPISTSLDGNVAQQTPHLGWGGEVVVIPPADNAQRT
jgi:hypothetical protein